MYHFSDHKGYTIFLHIELFGYEDLLCELARKKIKIKLCKIQSILFKRVGMEEWFDFNGDPQITVWARFKDEIALKPREYKRFVLKFYLPFYVFNLQFTGMKKKSSFCI